MNTDMKNINDFLDLFAVSSIVKIYQSNVEAYNGSIYKIPSKFLYLNLESFKVCFEDSRIVYKFWL